MSRVMIVGDIYYADLYPGNALPGGGYPSQPIHHPGHPDHGLPSQPGHPGNRPPGSWGGPVDPGFGQGGGHPSQPIYHPGHPDHGLPSSPGRPSNELPPGGTEIPSNELPMPEPPDEYKDNLIVAIRKPNETDWTVKAYDDVTPGHDLPPVPGTPTTPIAPTPAPKRR